MLPKEHRLRHEKDIKALFAKGKSVFGMYAGIKFGKNSEDESRFTVVAGVKISKKAVARNRIKRRYRALLHNHIYDVVSGYDVLVLVKKEAIEATTEELEKDLLKTLTKAKLIT